MISFDRSDEFKEIAFLSWKLNIKKCEQWIELLLFRCENWFCRKIEEFSAVDRNAANESIEVRD
jgi:hypothetical protein